MGLRNPVRRKRILALFKITMKKGRERKGMGGAQKRDERRHNPETSEDMTKNGIFT